MSGSPPSQFFPAHLRLQTGFPVCVWDMRISGTSPASSPVTGNILLGSGLGIRLRKPGTAVSSLILMFNWSPWFSFLPLLFKMSRKDEPSQNLHDYSFLLTLCRCNEVSGKVQQDYSLYSTVNQGFCIAFLHRIVFTWQYSASMNVSIVNEWISKVTNNIK